MKPKILFKNIWADDDIIELKIITSSESSEFSLKAYIGYSQIKKISNELYIFKDHIHGGLYDLCIGLFGPEYASGAFSARFHFQEKGLLNLTVKMQSEFYLFGKKEVANEALLHLNTEPALLDRFVVGFKSISNSVGNVCELDCVNT